MDMHTSAFDLTFIIIGMKFNFKLEEGFFDEDEEKEISSFIDAMSEEMHVDSTYVEKEGSQFKNTFMLDEGWQSLCELVLDSRCCRELPDKQCHATLSEAFCTMGLCYMYECLSLKYDVSHITLEVDVSQDFEVVFTKDTSRSWKKYPGRWQIWDKGKGKSK